MTDIHELERIVTEGDPIESLPDPATCRALRQAANLGGEGPANVVGVSSQTLYAYERGRGGTSLRTNLRYRRLIGHLQRIVGDDVRFFLDNRGADDASA